MEVSEGISLGAWFENGLVDIPWVAPFEREGSSSLWR
jgi:hypothetical protein